MTHPEAVIEKAKQIELLLNRVEVGEPFKQVLAELDLLSASTTCPSYKQNM